jgi:transketolase
MQAAQVRGAGRVTTLEDHLPDGGFGSWLMESLSHDPDLRTRLDAVALDPTVCGLVGSQKTLNETGGLR